MSSANCTSSAAANSPSGKGSKEYDVRCRDQTYRDSKRGTDDECPEEEQASTLPLKP